MNAVTDAEVEAAGLAMYGDVWPTVSKNAMRAALEAAALCRPAPAAEIERLQAEVDRLSGPDPHGYKAAAEENLRRLSKGGAN